MSDEPKEEEVNEGVAPVEVPNPFPAPATPDPRVTHVAKTQEEEEAEATEADPIEVVSDEEAPEEEESE